MTFVRPVEMEGHTIGLVEDNRPAGHSMSRASEMKIPRLFPKCTKVLVACGEAVGGGPFVAEDSYVVVADHVNALGDNPLIGRSGCFPDMSDPYPQWLRDVALEAAANCGVAVRESTLVACPDPMHPPAWSGALNTCVFGSGVVEMTLLASGESVPTLGLLAVKPFESAACGNGHSGRLTALARFGLDCALRISKKLNHVK
ncbi:MAG: hypothetical protein K1Y02_19845 [Candidatus Hydrogenedentes bacterium]|nr:hypothetical protein [Candidatus Hydrogenedentota bacterium]